jgi:hypothetical protein
MAFRTDPGLKLPYQDNIAALLHEPSFRRAAGEAVFAKARYINTLRNRAVHEAGPQNKSGLRPFRPLDGRLERAAVREAFGEFLAAGVATAAQIEFINMVIEHLTDQGVMDPALLYEPPFTDVAPTGPDQLFDEEKVARLFIKIQAINDSAVA